MKSRIFLLLLIFFGYSLILDAQQITVTYGTKFDYGWGEYEIVQHFIHRISERDALFSNMTDRTKDSIVVIETYPDFYGKITCLLKDDSLYKVEYDYYDGYINKNPVDAFENFIANRNALMFQFYVYVKEGDKQYKEYDRELIAPMMKSQDIQLCAKRYMMDNMTNVALTYEKDGYHLHLSFEYKEFNVNMLPDKKL